LKAIRKEMKGTHRSNCWGWH